MIEENDLLKDRLEWLKKRLEFYEKKVEIYRKEYFAMKENLKKKN